MRSISNITIKCLAVLFAIGMLPFSAFATTMDHTLTLGMISVKTQFLNPLVAEEREIQSITALMYEGLMRIDDNYKPVKNLVSDCISSDGGKLLTFKMRKDVTFHDGRPCTAYDVEATVNEILRLANENQGQYAQLKYIISSVKVSNAEIIEFSLKRSYYGSLYAFTFPILPKDQIAAQNPVGTGPFKLDYFVPKDYLYLSANENWWNGAPTVKNINVLFSETNKELITDYEFNMLDAAITRSASAGQYRTGLTNLNITYRTRQLEVILMNDHKIAFPLDDDRVRKAIRYAIDLDSIVNSVYMGMAQRTDTPLPSGMWLYNDSIQHEYNPDKARALLAEAGWVESLDDDDILDKVVDGQMKRLRLGIYVYEEQTNSVRVQVANHIASYLAAVGIETHVEIETFASISNRLQKRNFDICIAAFQMDVIPDPGFLLMAGNTGNYCGYSSKAMDNLFKDLRKEQDEFQYQQLLFQIQQLFYEDCPFICMHYRSGALLTRKVFTTVRDVREPEILRGIESIGK
ncbi:MAG: hypothetical protein IJD39_04570 [Clostridia bacterium]|nr:hypothetical protein [Clostridia bacterium]